MQHLSRLNQLINPVALALRLLPVFGRLLMLALAAVISVVLMAVFPGSLDTLEERLGAQGWLMSADDTPEQRITIVAIDEASLAEIGAWPWPRSDMARLVSALNDAGVQLQLHDITYPEVRDGDAELIAALNASRGAVLAQVPVLQANGQSEQNVRTGVMSFPLTGLDCSSMPAASSTNSFIAPHAGFSAIPKGHIAPIVASDGAIREVPAFVCVDGEAYPALALSALLQATNAPTWAASVSDGSGLFAPEQVLRLDAYPGLTIPLDEAGNLRISYKDLPQNFRAVSAADVINGRIDPGMLENAWVLVGGTAFGMGDIVPTPYNGATPGVELQARLLGSLLDTTMPYTPRGAQWLLALLALIFAGITLLLAGARERVAAYGLPVAAVLMPVITLALHWQLLAAYEIWLGWLFPAVFGLLAASLLLLLEQSRVRAERSRVFGNLNSYLPSDIAREIAFSLPSSAINAKRCDVTLLSADLRNFSAFGEARPPEESAALLHFFFVKAAGIVEHHGGRIQEFKGDSLLAVWDGQSADEAHRALAAGQEMLSIVDRDMPQHPPAGLEPLALGIGIEQGPALMGSIGPAHRRTHTLLGDTVTITLRIQDMTAELAQPILLGECVARQLSDMKPESQGSYLLNGLRIPHTLFAPAIDATQTDSPRRNARAEQLNLKIVSGGKGA
ncbi:CHASE2 domain-containing protein [Pseudohongiella sp.]|uniref:Guanylate cyclase domain-containing protein n=1 Tax=marine sediment metagenome TaxID=412755 RepID=A0A0F9YVG4_9ZZZZ|nr:adenylate/guanylate cyclase domain-containing protein [Pseudohongiella sp.]HDZ08732.1 adenylate/guanylate cyclase domain-containing protein [Pseudohongiella sp.]HEA62348.1 adenylate/guanylate cyclase domain-containing protein [Pseudohongiella sp.]